MTTSSVTRSPVTTSSHFVSIPNTDENHLLPSEKIRRIALALFWGRKCEIITNSGAQLNIQPGPQKGVSSWKEDLETLLQIHGKLHFCYPDSSGEPIFVSVVYLEMQRQKAFVPFEPD